MFSASKFLPAMALAVALSPLAAHAGSTQAYQTPQNHAQVDAVTPSSATIANPTRVYTNNAFPDSFGG
ncbi:MAG TPA: hypothetical protein VNC39_11725 [Acidocella sp.]|jgi:hypothetical protein|uniref:hypothetical protein n=1 Tax=Acidocella sp. TaxID=50710 RepID=UPI002CAA6D66|nr:hypothetical protein [Acidocella sp.]HVE22639.1 hypothetical protein [Acidocella sp.]